MTLFEVEPLAEPAFLRATVTDVRTVVVEITVHPGDDPQAEALLAAHEALGDPANVPLHHTTTVVLLEQGLPLS